MFAPFAVNVADVPEQIVVGLFTVTVGVGLTVTVVVPAETEHVPTLPVTV